MILMFANFNARADAAILSPRVVETPAPRPQRSEKLPMTLPAKTILIFGPNWSEERVPRRSRKAAPMCHNAPSGESPPDSFRKP
jgi:hypothetical protein